MEDIKPSVDVKHSHLMDVENSEVKPAQLRPLETKTLIEIPQLSATNDIRRIFKSTECNKQRREPEILLNELSSLSSLSTHDGRSARQIRRIVHEVRDRWLIMSTRQVAEFEVLFRRICTDPDPRIRISAVTALDALYRGRRMLSMDSYRVIRSLCTNSSQNVRKISLNIMTRYAAAYPEREVKSERGYDVRLVDDAFSSVCHAMNDSATEIRTEAAELLGRFRGVSMPFLQQTLDKKAMFSASRFSADLRFANSSWGTGKMLNEPSSSAADNHEEEDETKSMVPSGACGAFVTALEDEFMSVRQAAVFSIGKLGANRGEFARSCIDHLADMFNDEMQQVRLDSINALSNLIAHGKLDRDQLQTILSVLSDATPETRLALHELLGRCRVRDAACVRQVLKALMESLHRFPRDRSSIFACISKVGRRHPGLVQSIINDLLNLHPWYASQEQDVGDDFYLCHLILIFNAAATATDICAALPKHIIRHYRYLRCEQPTLVPVLMKFETSGSVISGTSIRLTDKTLAEVDEHLAVLFERVVDAYEHPDPAERDILLEMFLRDFKISDMLEPEVATPYRFIRVICEVFHLYDRAMRRVFDNVAILRLIENCTVMITQLQHLFNGIPASLRAFLAECGLHLSILYTFIRLDTDATWNPNIADIVATEARRTQQYLCRIRAPASDETCQFLPWLLDEFLPSHHYIIEEEEDAEEMERREAERERIEKEKAKNAAERAKIEAQKESANKGDQNKPPPLSAVTPNGQPNPAEEPEPPKPLENKLPELREDIQIALATLGSAQLYHPVGDPNFRQCTLKSIRILDVNNGVQAINADVTVRFVAGLPTAVNVNAILYHLTDDDMDYLRMEITYPDESRVYQRLRECELHRLSETAYNLHAPALICTDSWSDAMEVRIRVGLLTDSEPHSVERTHSARFHPPLEPFVVPTFLPARRRPTPPFVALMDVERPGEPMLIRVRIQPMMRC